MITILYLKVLIGSVKPFSSLAHLNLIVKMLRLQYLIRAIKTEVIGHTSDIIHYHALIASFPLNVHPIHLSYMVIETCGKHVLLLVIALFVKAVLIDQLVQIACNKAKQTREIAVVTGENLAAVDVAVIVILHFHDGSVDFIAEAHAALILRVVYDVHDQRVDHLAVGGADEAAYLFWNGRGIVKQTQPAGILPVPAQIGYGIREAYGYCLPGRRDQSAAAPD